MTVQRLILAFSKHQNAVQVGDVRDQIVEWGFYDSIPISPFDKNPDDLLGTMVELSVPVPPPYASDRTAYAVRFNQNVSLNWQRLICVKELVHSLDPVQLKVGSKIQLDAMLKQMLLEDRDLAIENLPALYEDVAVFQALAILCPEEVREVLYTECRAIGGEPDYQGVARRFQIPVAMAFVVMTPNWLGFRNRLAGVL